MKHSRKSLTVSFLSRPFVERYLVVSELHTSHVEQQPSNLTTTSKWKIIQNILRCHLVVEGEDVGQTLEQKIFSSSTSRHSIQTVVKKLRPTTSKTAVEYDGFN